MRVIRTLPDSSVQFIGSCYTFTGVKPKETVIVSEPLPKCSDVANIGEVIRTGYFKVVPIYPNHSEMELVIEAKSDSPPLEWLPGWRPL